MRPCSKAAAPSAAKAAAGAEAATAAAAPSRNSRLSIKAPSIERLNDSGGVYHKFVRNRGKPARQPQGAAIGLALEPSRQESAQLRPRSLSRIAVIGERHPHDLRARAELCKVKAVGRARIDDELHHAWRLPLRQLARNPPPASPRPSRRRGSGSGCRASRPRHWRTEDKKPPRP